MQQQQHAPMAQHPQVQQQHYQQQPMHPPPPPPPPPPAARTCWPYPTRVSSIGAVIAAAASGIGLLCWVVLLAGAASVTQRIDKYSSSDAIADNTSLAWTITWILFLAYILVLVAYATRSLVLASPYLLFVFVIMLAWLGPELNTTFIRVRELDDVSAFSSRVNCLAAGMLLSGLAATVVSIGLIMIGSRESWHSAGTGGPAVMSTDPEGPGKVGGVEGRSAVNAAYGSSPPYEAFPAGEAPSPVPYRPGSEYQPAPMPALQFQHPGLPAR